MKKPRNILVDYDLFVDLYVYACRYSEPDDLQFKRLCAGVRKKFDAMMRHELYSLYKSGADEITRKKARLEYLDAIGLSDSFRWDSDRDVNITLSDMDIR